MYMRQQATDRRLPQGTPRPVYVAPDRPIRIEVHDGALCFRTQPPSEPAEWIPLRHISRLLVPETAEMDLSVLLACARRGIPVLVQDAENETLLRGIPGRQDRLPDLRSLLVDRTYDLAWYSQYRDWRDAQAQRIAGIVARRLGWVSSRPARELFAACDREAERLVGKEGSERSRRFMQGACLAWMQAELVQRGMDARNDAWLRDRVDLAVDLSTLLCRQLEPVRLGYLRRIRIGAQRRHGQPAPLDHKSLVRQLERRRARLERTGADLLNRLHRWLVEGL